MSFLRNVGILLLYINSLSYALQCTTNCSFQLMLNAPYEIPADCDKIESAKICEVRISTYYRYGYSYISLSTSPSNTFIGDVYYASIDLSSYGHVSYSIDHQCKNKDDCAREFVLTKIPYILNRPPIDFEAMKLELLPLLSSNLSVETNDLACFDSNENVRQCAIAKNPGVCQVSHELTRKRKPTRSCDRELIEVFGTDPRITIFDLGNYASFSIKCNRSLCNGPVTSQFVKEIVFKYNITKTIEGRLNNGLCLSLSSIFLIFNIILLSSF